MGHRPSDMGEADSDVAGDGDVEARFDHGTSWAIGTPWMLNKLPPPANVSSDVGVTSL
jgi:hypothetical protein